MSKEIAHVTVHQRAALHRRLLARARTLSGEIGSGLRSERLHEEAFDAPSIGEAAVAVSGVQRDADELQEVLEALARLDRGAYGVCVDCGCALPYVRLDAMPEASRCVQCESDRERTKAAPASL